MKKPIGKPAGCLQRMTECVAEVEQSALAGFALVSSDDAGLAATGHGDGVFARGISGNLGSEDVAPVHLQPAEEPSVAEQAVFDEFGVAGAEFARGQRVEQRGI